MAITPAAGFVGPLSAVAIGLLAGVACYVGVLLKSRFGYDDALDVVGIHAVGGTLGALATGVFASQAINSSGANGLLFGGGLSVLGIQAIAAGATIAYSFVASLVLLKLVDLTVGLRVSEEEEETGLDLSQHSEVGYAF